MFLTLILSLTSSLTAEQKEKVQAFTERIKGEKILTEVQKLMFDYSHYARFLKSQEFDEEKALDLFKGYLNWRKANQVDILLDSEVPHQKKLKAYLPNGWFEHDKEGNPVFLLNLGQANPRMLLETINAKTLIKYFLTEVENTWRTKFKEVEEKVFGGKQPVE